MKGGKEEEEREYMYMVIIHYSSSPSIRCCVLGYTLYAWSGLVGSTSHHFCCVHDYRTYGRSHDASWYQR